MLAHVWSAGPSLPRVSPASCDALVTVNRAAQHAAWHRDYGDLPMPWWVAAVDREGFFPILTTGPALDGLVTDERHAAYADGLLDALQRDRVRVVSRQSATALCGVDFPNVNNSKIAALALCFVLGATRVIIFGDDMDGATYCDGSRCGADAARWERERRYTSQAIEALDRAGCVVVYADRP